MERALLWRRVTSTTSAGGAGYATLRRTDPRIAAYVHAALGDARTVINVGAGAGSYEPEDRYVVAVEPCAQMRAQRRTPAVIAVAEDLPFDDDSFDAAMATVTIHQWPDLERGLRELRRVAAAPVVILTFDGAAMHAFWLDEYVPEVFASERARDPALERVAADRSAATSPSRRSRSRSTASTASSRPTTRGPRRCWTRRSARRSRPGRSPTPAASSAACDGSRTRSSRASGTRATATCARSRSTSAHCAS